MKFRCDLYRASDPTVAVPVLVEYKRMFHVGFPSTRFEFEVSAYVDRDEDGEADTTVRISHLDFQQKYEATEAQLPAVDVRLVGGANLMQTVRNFVKSQVTAHNQAVSGNPSYVTAFVNLDTDTV